MDSKPGCSTWADDGVPEGEHSSERKKFGQQMIHFHEAMKALNCRVGVELKDICKYMSQRLNTSKSDIIKVLPRIVKAAEDMKMIAKAENSNYKLADKTLKLCSKCGGMKKKRRGKRGRRRPIDAMSESTSLCGSAGGSCPEKEPPKPKCQKPPPAPGSSRTGKGRSKSKKSRKGKSKGKRGGGCPPCSSKKGKSGGKKGKSSGRKSKKSKGDRKGPGNNPSCFVPHSIARRNHRQ